MVNSFSVIEDDNGREVREEPQIAAVIEGYFEKIFTSTNNTNFSALTTILSNKVSVEMNDFLTSIPSDSEIHQAVLSINGGKAPGPDGFSAKFYQSYWHIISKDFCRDIRRFFSSDTLHPQQNETHI